MVTYRNHTLGDDFPSVVYRCPGFFTLQVLIITPYEQVTESTPVESIQPVPLLVVGWMRTTGPSQEVRW